MISLRSFGTAIKRALYLLLILFISSCIESDRTIGSQFLPDDYKLEVATKSFPLAVEMRLADSLTTDYPNYMSIGSFYEPEFGSVVASTAFRIIPMKQGQTFGDAPIVKSLKLEMGIQASSYIVPDQQYIPQVFRVYELLKDIDSTTIYSNSFTEEDIGEESIEVSGNLFFGRDSLVLQLSPQFGEKLVQVSEEESDSLLLFLEKYKGLYITCDEVDSQNKGGRLNLTTPSNLYMSLTYRHIDQEKSIDRDSTVGYYISDNQPYLNIYKHSSQGLVSEEPDDLLYLEGLAGVRPYINFEHLKGQIEEWATVNSIDFERLIVIRGELEFSFDYPDNFRELNNYPTQLFLTTRNPSTKESIRYEPLTDIYYSENNGMINRSLKKYSLDITSYIQKVLQNKVSKHGLESYLTPIYQTSDYYSGSTLYNVQNYLYYKALLKGPQSDAPPKLILTYSILP